MSDHDVEVRLRHAEALLADCEARTPVEPRALDHVRHLVDRILAVVRRGSGHWFTARLLRVWVLRHGSAPDLDDAIADLRLLLGHADPVELRTELADLLLRRYNAAPSDDRSHLCEAISLLWTLADDDLTGPQRGPVESLLGLALVEQFRWQRKHDVATPRQLDEAQSVLQRCLRHLDAGDPQRAEVLLELARLHLFRSTVGEPGFTADAARDRNASIYLFRLVADTDDRAARDLAEALSRRYLETSRECDRDEAVALLRRLDGIVVPLSLN